jgi:hypothetical protein
VRSSPLALASPFGRRGDAKAIASPRTLTGILLARASRRERLGFPQVEQLAFRSEELGVKTLNFSLLTSNL